MWALLVGIGSELQLKAAPRVALCTKSLPPSPIQLNWISEHCLELSQSDNYAKWSGERGVGEISTLFSKFSVTVMVCDFLTTTCTILKTRDSVPTFRCLCTSCWFIKLLWAQYNQVLGGQRLLMPDLCLILSSHCKKHDHDQLNADQGWRSGFKLHSQATPQAEWVSYNPSQRRSARWAQWSSARSQISMGLPNYCGAVYSTVQIPRTKFLPSLLQSDNQPHDIKH